MDTSTQHAARRRSRRRCSTLAVGVAALVGAVAPAAPVERPPLVVVPRAEVRPTIDGVLDDPTWKDVAIVDDFTMQLPQEGIPASDPTVVRITYDSDNLYLGITCYDSTPEAIRVTSLLRDDFAQTNGEQLAFAIDSSDSGRDGFWFSTNAGGAQIDSQIFDEGRVFDREWDGVWESAGRIHDEGWTVEIRIPFHNLRFPAADENIMRINFFRAIRHRNEEDYAPFIPRNYRGTLSFSLGRPFLFRGIRRGRDLELKPYALVQASGVYTGEPDTDLTGDAGLDVKWGITPGLTADFTVNTDFAQVEADDQQINLTRFPLFFPEKREFFLESAGLFRFGLEGRTEAFFSRRIGLDGDGMPVPILGGGRLSGRVGGLSVGALHVVTDDTDDQPRTSYSVARVRRDVARRSSIGVIATDRRADGPAAENTLVGTDARFVFNQDHSIVLYAMGSDDAASDSRGLAARMQYDKAGDLWRWGVSTDLVDEDFQPGIGFVRRTGVWTQDGFLVFRPRPNNESVRQLETGVSFDYVEGRGADEAIDGRIRDRGLSLFHNVEFESGDRLSVDGSRRLERVIEDFPIFDGVTITPGDYINETVTLGFNTWSSRRLSGFAFGSHGRFFGGRRTGVDAGLTWRIDHRVTVGTSMSYNRVRLPVGEFDTNLWITRVSYAFSPRLFGGALLQWNDVTDTLDLNLRMNWIHTPGADLFLVFNQSLDTDRDPGDPRTLTRAGIVKLTYLFKF